MSKVQVLVISVDVSHLDDNDIEALAVAMEVQTEEFDAQILNSGVKEIDVEELLGEDPDYPMPSDSNGNGYKH